MATILFGTLLCVAACQKIDADDLQRLEQSQKKENKADKKTDEVSEEDTTKLKLQTMEDGTLFFPSDRHVVALELEKGEESSKVLYVSLYEWEKVKSAYSDDDPGMALAIAEKYKEGDVTGWRLPTRDEAALLRNKYNRSEEGGELVNDDALQTLNDEILEAGGKKMYAMEKNDRKPAYRYLCEEATYTFSLKTGSKTSKAGRTATYYLRLVKDTVTSNSK